MRNVYIWLRDRMLLFCGIFRNDVIRHVGRWARRILWLGNVAQCFSRSTCNRNSLRLSLFWTLKIWRNSAVVGVVIKCYFRIQTQPLQTIPNYLKPKYNAINCAQIRKSTWWSSNYKHIYQQIDWPDTISYQYHKEWAWHEKKMHIFWINNLTTVTNQIEYLIQ